MLTPPAEIRTHSHRFSCTLSCTQGGQAALRGEIHASQQILEAWIRTQTVEHGVDLEQNQPLGTLLVRSFQPMESFVLLAQSSVDVAYDIGRYVSLFRQLIQLLQDLIRVVAATGCCVGFTERSKRGRTGPKITCLCQFSNGCFMERLARIRPPKEHLCHTGFWVECESLLTLLDCLIIPARIEIDVP